MTALIAYMQSFDLYIHLSNSSGSCGRNSGSGGLSVSIAIDLSLRAITGDVAGLSAAVASFAGCVEWSTVRGSAVTGDVSYHGLERGVPEEEVTETYPTCRRHSTSLPEPGNPWQSGWDHRTCSKWPVEDRQRSRP
jgi:hypothetical protein